MGRPGLISRRNPKSLQASRQAPTAEESIGLSGGPAGQTALPAAPSSAHPIDKLEHLCYYDIVQSSSLALPLRCDRFGRASTRSVVLAPLDLFLFDSRINSPLPPQRRGRVEPWASGPHARIVHQPRRLHVAVGYSGPQRSGTTSACISPPRDRRPAPKGVRGNPPGSSARSGRGDSSGEG